MPGGMPYGSRPVRDCLHGGGVAGGLKLGPGGDRSAASSASPRRLVCPPASRHAMILGTAILLAAALPVAIFINAKTLARGKPQSGVV